MQSRVCVHCSLFLSHLPPRQFLPPRRRPTVSCSLRYPYKLRSRTHIVLRMYTRAYTRRVLRKLAPYASIQISQPTTRVSALCVISLLVLPLARHIVLLSSLHSPLPPPSFSLSLSLYSHPLALSVRRSWFIPIQEISNCLMHGRGSLILVKSVRKCMKFYDRLRRPIPDILLIWDALCSKGKRFSSVARLLSRLLSE